MITLDLSKLDDRDRTIVSERMVAYWGRATIPQVGDWIRFADGVEARIAYCWRGDDWAENAQTADPPNGGSFYLGQYGCSYSGSLDSGVPLDKLRQANEVKIGAAWIFHHDWHTAGGGRDFRVPFQVWLYDGPSEDAR